MTQTIKVKSEALNNTLYTPKQHSIMQRALTRDWRLMVNHGAVRAGKTVLNNDLFLMELLRAKKLASVDGIKEPMFILAAASSSALQNNVLQELTNKYGIEFKFDKHGNFKLFGVKVITTFTETIRGIAAIRGMTAYGAYINEASLANKEVFDEIIKRCSGAGSRILCDTNPDHPKHWLKVNYIDKADGDRIIENNFKIFDNNFLSEQYIKDTIQTTPSGAMTERGIYGRWTAGEGVVYADFDGSKHYIKRDEVPKNIQKYIAGVDWGYRHYGSLVVVGIDDKGDYYMIEENAHQDLHIDQWIEIAQDVAGRYGERIPFYCDSARPEYVDAFYYAGLNAFNANKARIPGITEVAKLIRSDKFFVVDDLVKFADEINTYVWSKNGDEPDKTNDDVLDGLRYAIYSDKIANLNTIVA